MDSSVYFTNPTCYDLLVLMCIYMSENTGDLCFMISAIHMYSLLLLLSP